MSARRNQDNFLISIKDLWELVIGHLYWFILSLVIALSIALIYIIITPPTFTRTASVMIKSNTSNGRSTPSLNESLNEFGLFNPNTDIKSEVYIMSSPELMETVVKRLKLDYNYSMIFRKVRNVDIYNSTPITVGLDSILSKKQLSFDVNLLKNNKFTLLNLIINDTKYDFEINGTLSDTLRTPYGNILISPTAVYPANYIGKTIYFSKQSIKAAATACNKALSIKYDEKDAPILWLSYVDVNPQRAEDILNTLISVYNENWIKDRNQVTVSTSNFIDDRLHIIENELGGVDQDISSYKSENLLPSIEAVSSMYLAQSNNNTTRQITLQNQLSMARYIRSYMSEASSKNQLIPANTGIESANIESSIEKYNALLLQKNNLLSNSSEQNPVVADMIKNLNAMRDYIIRSIDEYLATLNIQMDNIKRNERFTNQKIASNPNQAKHLLSIERQQKVKESLYLFLLQKREESELSQTFSAYNTKIINSPNGSNIPTAPRKNVIILTALIIGILLPTILLIIIQNFDTLVRGRDDIKGLTIPFLGEIPAWGIKKRRFWLRKQDKTDAAERVKIVVASENRNVINEAFRNIRNNIDFIRQKSDKGTIIMTTSSFAGSGKTFITSNLAVSMAIKGAKTIILDVDLRKATLSKMVDSPQKGLSNYLAQGIDSIENVIVKSHSNPNLEIIPAGKIPPNPSELILGQRFGELLNFLRSHYDYIFLDCPPIEIVSETAVIGAMCDMTLFVIRVGIFDKRMLPEIEQTYINGQLKNMATILNDVNYSRVRYGYGKYGNSRYGYGKYGYSNTEDHIERDLLI